MWAENSPAVSVSVVKSRRAVATARCPATNSTRHPWRTFSALRSKTHADLSGLADVRAAAGAEVEVVNVDDAQFVAVGDGNFAQAQLPCFFTGDEANVDGAILQNDFIGQALGGFDLIFGQSSACRDRWSSSRRPCGTKRSAGCTGG